MDSYAKQSHAHDTVDVRPIDPLNEIDGKKTFLWAVIFTVVVFGGMALLAGSFAFILEDHQRSKIYDRDTAELNALRAREAAELSRTGDNGDGTARISIEDALRRAAQK